MKLEAEVNQDHLYMPSLQCPLNNSIATDTGDECQTKIQEEETRLEVRWTDLEPEQSNLPQADLRKQKTSIDFCSIK
jgi:hypothetical protein